LKLTLKQWQVKIVHINEEISTQASFFVENFFLSNSMQLADALIGATCLNYAMKLYTANDKHYKVIKGLEIEIFRP
jgi:predicted nucleic acid-binding protein